MKPPYQFLATLALILPVGALSLFQQRKLSRTECSLTSACQRFKDHAIACGISLGMDVLYPDECTSTEVLCLCGMKGFLSTTMKCLECIGYDTTAWEYRCQPSVMYATRVELFPREPQDAAPSDASPSDAPPREDPPNSPPPDEEKPTPRPDQDPILDEGGNLGAGAVAGVIIGVAVGVGAIAFGLFYWSKKARKDADIVEPPYQLEQRNGPAELYDPYTPGQVYISELDGARMRQELPGAMRPGY